MKNATAWLKSNWLIVVLGVVALAALPTAMFFSMSQSSKFEQDTGKKLSDDHQALNANKNAYYVADVTGTRLMELNTEINPRLNELYRAKYEELSGKAAAAAKAGEEFNKSDHTLLVEGLFPAPDELVKATKKSEFLRAFAGPFHQELLRRMNAGMPPSVVELNGMLEQHVASHMERLQNERGNTEMNDQEKLLLQSELFAIRLSRYKARATEITTYADAGVFDKVSTVDVTAPIPMHEAWDLQERAWLHADLVKAVARANGLADAGSSAAKPGVPDAVIKRLIRVAPEPAVYAGGGAAAFDQGTDKAPVNYNRSLTGRVSGPGMQNRWYDVRNVTVECIASSKRLPEFIDALGGTNFVTVLEMDLASVDVFEELKSGFYYGDEHVVRVMLKLESVMLRSWREADMPVEVKRALGMVEGEAGSSQDGYTPPPERDRRESFGEG